MNQHHRHATGPGAGSELTYLSFGAAAVVLVLVEAAVHAGAALAGWRRQPTWNPLVLAIDLARGRVAWPSAATAVLIGTLVVLALAGGALAAGLLRRRRGPAHPDRAARLMATGRDLASVSIQNAKRTADRFGVDAPGLPVARAIAGGQMLYATWEDMQTDIAGPRRLKTSARAIPTIVGAPGACFATSNKPDLYAATRLLREQRGKVWTLDPEGIAGEPARLVVESAVIRDLRPPRDRAHGRVRRRLPAP